MVLINILKSTIYQYTEISKIMNAKQKSSWKTSVKIIGEMDEVTKLSWTDVQKGVVFKVFF